MERIIKRIKLYVKDDVKAKKVSMELQKELKDNKFEIVNENYDLAISIGGDGTFLKMVRENNFNSNIYYVGINAGTLGFLQEIDINKTLDFTKKLANNDFKEELLSIEETIINTENQVKKYYSLNEIVVRKSNWNYLESSIYIDNEILEDFAGDGLLISTSTGSTAYNKSLGGAIVYNTLKTLSITPIAPINNKNYKTLSNSIIIPEDKIIDIIPTKKENLFFMIDGKVTNLKDVTKIESKIAKKKIKCLRMNDFHFIHVVNTKIIK